MPKIMAARISRIRGCQPVLSAVLVLLLFGQTLWGFRAPLASPSVIHKSTSITSLLASPRRRHSNSKKYRPSRGPRYRRSSFDFDDDPDDDRFVQKHFEAYDEDFDLSDDEEDEFGFRNADYENDDMNESPTFDINSALNNIQEVGAHFFSRKPLDDPAFRAGEDEGDLVFDQLTQGAGITRPSRIQSLAWPVVLSGKHTLIADQTGSGKTLAYLLPLLQRAISTSRHQHQKAQQQQSALPKNTPKKLNGAPRTLILAPTSELADQVRAVCDKLSTNVPFRTMVVTATGKYSTSIRDQIRMLQRQPVDVLISTPGRLSTIVRTRNSGLDLSSRLQALVLDEVDILMMNESDNPTSDEGLLTDQRGSSTFGPQLRTIGQAVGERLNQTQFIFVTATLPDRIVQSVTSEFPGVVQIKGPGLHRVAPSMIERLIDVSVPSNENRNSKLGLQVKARELLKTLRMTRCRRTLIFCNTVQSCRAVENLLKRSDRKRQRYDVRAYHNAMTPEARNMNLDIFSNAGESPSSTSKARPQGRQSFANLDYILVCTDRAARGVDFGASPVDHVVLFDFPRDPAEYVRRVGRTARAGREGTCTVFAYGWQLPVARSVMGKTAETLKTNGFNTSVDENGAEAMEYRGGAQGRRQHKQKHKGKPPKGRFSCKSNQRDAVVKNNIEEGRLWKG